MSKTLMNDSMKAGGYSQEEAYFHKDNLEKIEAIRAARKGGSQNADPEAPAGTGAKIIPFPQPKRSKTQVKKAA